MPFGQQYFRMLRGDRQRHIDVTRLRDAGPVAGVLRSKRYGAESW